jgi:hypothetical protein
LHDHFRGISLIRFALIPVLALLLGACAQQDAFEYFTTDPEFEKAAMNLRTARIVENNQSAAIISAVYLNRVYPEYNEGFEYFLVSFYARDHSSLLPSDANASGSRFRLMLNGTLPGETTQLQEGDRLRELMPIDTIWNDYYLLVYPQQFSDTLILKLENDRSGQAVLRFQKDER